MLINCNYNYDKLTFRNVAKGLWPLACTAVFCAFGVFYLKMKSLPSGISNGIILAFTMVFFAAMVLTYGFRIFANHMIVKYGLRGIKHLATALVYFLISALVNLMLLKFFSICANMFAPMRTLLVLTAFSTVVSCMVSEFSLKKVMYNKWLSAEADDDFAGDSGDDADGGSV